MRSTWALRCSIMAFVSLPLCAQGRPDVIAPRLVSIPLPDCGFGKQCHSHGHVRLILNVMADGKVGDVRVEVGEGDLADAATAAAEQAEFIPGTLGGKPQDMYFVLNMKL